MAKQVFRLDFCGRVITVETGEIAKQAGGSVLVRYDDTVYWKTQKKWLSTDDKAECECPLYAAEKVR